jgi:phage repressor protein C with HTH and peptisase S24 domain
MEINKKNLNVDIKCPSHEDVWRAIDMLALTHGLSVSGLAKKAGLDSTAFNKSKRIQPTGKLRWPSMESIIKVLNATNSSLEDFTTYAQMEIKSKTSKSKNANKSIEIAEEIIHAVANKKQIKA